MVTVGIFDGVHQGHKKILDRLIRRAEQYHTSSLVMTFDPHPRQVLSKEKLDLKFINTIEERIELLTKTGISALLIIPFTLEFASIEADDFVRDIFVKQLHIRHIISGYDHTFGRYGKGNFMLLEEMSRSLGFETEEIPAHDIDMAAVSSTRTREAITAGKVALAAKLLGYPYFFRGTVVRGLQIGTSIGYPTANIKPDNPQKLIPTQGVFSVRVKTDTKLYHGMMNIGIRPTLDGTEQSIEAHLFECSENLYGQTLEVSFVDYIRAEQKFESLSQLSERLAVDAEIAKKQLMNTKT